MERRQTFSRLMAVALLVFCAYDEACAELRVSPAEIELTSPESSQQLLVWDVPPTGRARDVSRSVQFAVERPELATVDDRGLVRPLADGETLLVIRGESEELRIPIHVRAFRSPQPVSFRNEVIPILTKAGCNSGGCHGKAEGQGGFRLSIFGYDSEHDFASLVQEGRGRRISVASPDRSLLLRKGASRIPHGGGRRIEPDGYQDRLLRRWIAEGASFATESETDTIVRRIEVQPDARRLLAGEAQQLQVTAVDEHGRRRCVTREAEFESSSESIAAVDERGLVEASDNPGEAVVLIRYLGHVTTCRITQPQPGVTFPRPPAANFIDELAWDKLESLGIPPSELSDDGEFLRRLFLDTIGTLPTAAEAREFLEDPADDKRARMIDRVLERNEYADYWAMRWLDLLRADQLVVSPQGTVAMQRWLRHGFLTNVPYDQIAEELLTYQGNTSAEGPGAFYKAVKEPQDAAQAISQLFLGVRIECARCHHHPSERWTQADHTGFAGFFTGLRLKPLPNGEQALVSQLGQDLPHPRTGEAVPAQALGSAPANFTGVTDRRQILAAWMTAPENPFFARAAANRLWSHYFGRGLVEPIDDLRETNPATNEPLLQALAEHLHAVQFDVKAFTRTLLNSRLYQLSARTVPANATDAQSFSHAYDKTLPAEVLLDAICQATGVEQKFNGWPEGYRAIQIWDNRMPSYFFRIFGRPVRATVCECERSDEPSIAQALHLMNAPEIQEKVAHRDGRARLLAESQRTPGEIVDELFLSTLSRFPTPREQKLLLPLFAELDRRAVAEDILWTIINTREFVFNH